MKLIIKTKKSTGNFSNIFSQSISYPEYCIVTDFLSNLKQAYNNRLKNNEPIEVNEASDIQVFNNSNRIIYGDSIEIFPGGRGGMTFKYNSNQYCIETTSYIQQGELKCSVSISKDKNDGKSLKSIWKSILKCALNNSELKGNVIEFKNIEKFNYKIVNVKGFPSLDDVYVHPNIKEELDIYLEHFIETGEFYRYILAGEPGTGKTESVLSISGKAKEHNVTVFKASINEHFKTLIEFAELMAPSIVILDDIDLSLGSRTEGGVHSNNLQTFLDILDGVHKLQSNIGFIATTNSTQLIDQAASRPGRFDKILRYGYIDENIVAQLISKSIKHNLKDTEIENIGRTLLDNNIVDHIMKQENISGSFVYHKIRMIIDRIRLKRLELNTKSICDFIDKDVEMTKEATSKNFLTKSKNKVGFTKETSEKGIYNIEEIYKKLLVEKGQNPFKKNNDDDYEEEIETEIETEKTNKTLVDILKDTTLLKKLVE